MTITGHEHAYPRPSPVISPLQSPSPEALDQGSGSVGAIPGMLEFSPLDGGGSSATCLDVIVPRRHDAHYTGYWQRRAAVNRRPVQREERRE